MKLADYFVIKTARMRDARWCYINGVIEACDTLALMHQTPDGIVPATLAVLRKLGVEESEAAVAEPSLVEVRMKYQRGRGRSASEKKT